MAGCFGNSFFDRNMESQLMWHLNEEAAYSDWVEQIYEHFSEEFWNEKKDWIDAPGGDSLLNKLFDKKWAWNEEGLPDFLHLSKIIERYHKIFIK